MSSVKQEVGNVDCLICTYGFPVDQLTNHIAWVHFHYYEFKCGDCGVRLRDKDEVVKHRMMYGHNKEPLKIGSDMEYLRLMADQVASHWIQLAQAKDQEERQRRMAGFLVEISNCRDVVSTGTAEQIMPGESVPLFAASDVSDEDEEGLSRPKLTPKYGRNNGLESKSAGPVLRKRKFEPNSSGPSSVDSCRATVSSDILIANQLVSTTSMPPVNNHVSSKRVAPSFKVKKPVVTKFAPKRIRNRCQLKILSCSLCHEAVKNEIFPAIFTHAWDHVDFAPFVCSICGYDDMSREDVENHIGDTHYPDEEAEVLLPSVFQISEFCSMLRRCFSTRGDVLKASTPPSHPMFQVVERMKQFKCQQLVCAVCGKGFSSEKESKSVGHSDLCRHAAMHTLQHQFSCGVCDHKSWVTNHILHHCAWEHNGLGKPSLDAILEREDTFNHCFGGDENYPTVGEKVEVVERRFGERQFLPVVKGFDVVDKKTSMFKWKPIKSTTRCRCQYCPHEGWFARADLTKLSDHAWKCHFSPNYPPMCPFTCSVCGFGSVRVEEVDGHILLEHHAGEGEVLFPDTFTWSSFEAKFFLCFHMYFPVLAEWPEDFYGYRFITQFTEIVPTDVCGLCRHLPMVEGVGCIGHRVRSRHVYTHVGNPYSCSHGCRRALTKCRIRAHLRQFHKGVGSILEPSEELKEQMRQLFPLCFSPKYTAELDARQAEVLHTCHKCGKEVKVALTNDPRTDHVFRFHMPVKPYGCSRCDWRSYIFAGVHLHIAKTHKRQGHYRPPSSDVIEEFVEKFRDCFGADPPVVQMELLKGQRSSVPVPVPVEAACNPPQLDPNLPGPSSLTTAWRSDDDMLEGNEQEQMNFLSSLGIPLDQEVLVKVEELGDEIHFQRAAVAGLSVHPERQSVIVVPPETSRFAANSSSSSEVRNKLTPSVPMSMKSSGNGRVTARKSLGARQRQHRSSRPRLSASPTCSSSFPVEDGSHSGVDAIALMETETPSCSMVYDRNEPTNDDFSDEF